MSRCTIRVPAWASVTLALALALPAARAAELKDAEQKTHGANAAEVEVVDTYAFPGFKIVQFNLSVLSHYSYLLESAGEAVLVDPAREIELYVRTAKKDGVTIKGVYLTHSHADFVAGHTELAKALGVPVHISAKAGAEYPHQPLREGSTIAVGEAVVTILETPGHTPDGTCALVASKAKPGTPLAVFTGDTLFIGSIGRPDLMGGTISAAALASMAYDSWTGKLSALPDDTMVLPAHGAGSLCGAHLRDDPKSTIGTERRTNPALQHRSRSEFIAAVLDGLPEAPQYFKHNAAMNRKGPAPVDWAAMPPPVKPDAELADPAKHYAVDLRDAKAYAAGHIPNSVNIGLRGRLETWVGIMVPWGTRLLLTGEEAELKEAVRRLHRVGYAAEGLIPFAAYAAAGLPKNRNDAILPRDLHAQIRKGEGPVVVDVRLPSEWMAARIGQVVNLPLSHLDSLASTLDPSQPVVTVCNSAYRSSMAVGILERKGFAKAVSMDGGSEAWIAAGLPVLQAAAAGASASAPPLRDLRLPERTCAAELNRMILDQPGTFELVDIRPPAAFADYALPGSRNVDIGEVLANPAFLSGTVPLVLVDRDGSLAMAVGGILSQKSQRTIKVLHGGLEAYWDQAGVRPAAGAARGAATPAPPAAAPTAPAPAAPPAAPKKKSAGC
jgi:glyoxylase-like metal-dependent hydrolase (beta-lactamase superfamily II)/rhodanese-related sulfurtransferase